MNQTEPEHSSTPSSIDRNRTNAQWCVRGLYGLAALNGLTAAFLADDSIFPLILSLAFPAIVSSWAMFDAKARQKPLLPIVLMIFFFTWPVASLVYLIYRSGWKGVGIYLLNVVALGTLILATGFLSVQLAHFFHQR